MSQVRFLPGARGPATQVRPEFPPGTPTVALEEVAVDVAISAAQLIRRRSGQAQHIGTKTSPTDVVTAADVEVERFIRAELLAATPGATVRGEERDPVVGTTSIGWVIDPIDGTVNFLYDLLVISVSIVARPSEPSSSRAANSPVAHPRLKHRPRPQKVTIGLLGGRRPQ